LRNVVGCSIRRNLKIGKSFIGCEKVSIGDNVYIAINNFIACKEIKIGDDKKIILVTVL